MSLDLALAEVARVLDGLAIDHRLIGAAALAAHGVARSTRDVDLLAWDRRVLDPAVWSDVVVPGFTIEVRRGDALDPVAGVVRIQEEVEGDADWEHIPSDVDLVVLPGRWVPDVVASAGPLVQVGARLVQAVDAVGLVLLKLYAGGPQDAWDIASLLRTLADDGGLIAEVDGRVRALPSPCATLWSDLVRAHRHSTSTPSR